MAYCNTSSLGLVGLGKDAGGAGELDKARLDVQFDPEVADGRRHADNLDPRVVFSVCFEIRVEI